MVFIRGCITLFATIVHVVSCLSTPNLNLVTLISTSFSSDPCPGKRCKVYSHLNAPTFNENDDSISNWQKRFLIEYISSDNGSLQETVVMLYDFDLKGFVFYSDSQQIPREILNRVASKYVTVFGCRCFYIETETETETETAPALEPETETETKPAPAPAPETKPLNSTAGLYPVPGTSIFQNKISRGGLKPSSALARVGILQEKKINKFIRIGKFRDFNPLNPIEQSLKPKRTDPKKIFTWKDYVALKDL